MHGTTRRPQIARRHRCRGPRRLRNVEQTRRTNDHHLSTCRRERAEHRRDPRRDRGALPRRRVERPDVLTQRGVVRRDITKSFGSAWEPAEGVPTTLQLTVLAAGTGKPLTDAAV